MLIFFFIFLLQGGSEWILHSSRGACEKAAWKVSRAWFQRGTGCHGTRAVQRWFGWCRHHAPCCLWSSLGKSTKHQTTQKNFTVVQRWWPKMSWSFTCIFSASKKEEKSKKDYTSRAITPWSRCAGTNPYQKISLQCQQATTTRSYIIKIKAYKSSLLYHTSI